MRSERCSSIAWRYSLTSDRDRPRSARYSSRCQRSRRRLHRYADALKRYGRPLQRDADPFQRDADPSERAADRIGRDWGRSRRDGNPFERYRDPLQRYHDQQDVTASHTIGTRNPWRATPISCTWIPVDRSGTRKGPGDIRRYVSGTAVRGSGTPIHYTGTAIGSSATRDSCFDTRTVGAVRREIGRGGPSIIPRATRLLRDGDDLHLYGDQLAPHRLGRADERRTSLVDRLG